MTLGSLSPSIPLTLAIQANASFPTACTLRAGSAQVYNREVGGQAGILSWVRLGVSQAEPEVKILTQVDDPGRNPKNTGRGVRKGREGACNASCQTNYPLGAPAE